MVSDCPGLRCAHAFVRSVDHAVQKCICMKRTSQHSSSRAWYRLVGPRAWTSRSTVHLRVGMPHRLPVRQMRQRAPGRPCRATTVPEWRGAQWSSKTLSLGLPPPPPPPPPLRARLPSLAELGMQTERLHVCVCVCVCGEHTAPRTRPDLPMNPVLISMCMQQSSTYLIHSRVSNFRSIVIIFQYMCMCLHCPRCTALQLRSVKAR
jgi:hypothetical protein